MQKDAKLTLKEFNNIEQALKDAQEKTDPFLIADEQENLYISGDADNTKRKSKSYTLELRFPSVLKDAIPEAVKIIRESDNFIYGEYTVEDVYLSPREDFRVISSIGKILPFFNKLEEDYADTDENGELEFHFEELSDQEKLEIIVNMDREVLDAMYDIVQAFLQVSDVFLDCLLTSSVFATLFELIVDFPEAFNEADIFFGKPAEDK